MNSNLHLIHFIKRTVILAIGSFIFFAISLYLYMDRTNSSSELQNRVESLQNILERKNSELARLKKEEEKNRLFLQEHSNLYIIDKPENFDIYKTEKRIKNFIKLLSPKINIKVDYNGKKLTKKYKMYNIVITLKYQDRYLLNRLLDYLNRNYFIKARSIRYGSKRKDIFLNFYIVGKEGKSVISGR